jgi:hypothetical protein
MEDLVPRIVRRQIRRKDLADLDVLVAGGEVDILPPGLFGAAGGCAGSRPAWQLAQATPISTRGPTGNGLANLRTPTTAADLGSTQRSK